MEQTDVCQKCGLPYLKQEGHACAGPRRTVTGKAAESG
jgi:hypothetical protein